MLNSKATGPRGRERPATSLQRRGRCSAPFVGWGAVSGLMDVGRSILFVEFGARGADDSDLPRRRHRATERHMSTTRSRRSSRAGPSRPVAIGRCRTRASGSTMFYLGRAPAASRRLLRVPILEAHHINVKVVLPIAKEVFPTALIA